MDRAIHPSRHWGRDPSERSCETVPSTALALGENLPTIAKLLGHRRIESTARYAHLERSAVRQAAERVAISLAKEILPDVGE